MIMYSLLLHSDATLLHQAKIHAAFAKYGCNMRTLFDVLVRKEEGDVLRTLREKLSRLSLSDIHGMMLGDIEVSDRTSHSLIKTECSDQPKPGEETYGRSDIPSRSISSPIVWQTLSDMHGRSLYAEIPLMDHLVQRAPEMSSAGGCIWEAYCHARIYNGGDYTLLRMTARGVHLVPRPTDSTVLHIASLTPKVFDPDKDSAASTSSPSEYYIPEAKGTPTFDSFFLSGFTQISIQITTSIIHSLENRGLLALKKRLPTGFQQYIVFVVPKNRGAKFKCEKPSPMPKNTRFFMLEFDPEHSKCYVVSVDIRH